MTLLMKLLLLLLSATQALLAQSINTLTIDWSDGPLATDLGTVSVDTNVVIVWSIFGNPDNLTLSVLLELDLGTGNPTVVTLLAAGDVPNNGSFLWSVDDVTLFGGGYYIRLQTGNSSDWDDGTGTTPPTPDGVYGLAGFFTINPPSTTSSATSVSSGSTSVVSNTSAATETTSTSPRVTGSVTATATTSLALTHTTTTTSSRHSLSSTHSTSRSPTTATTFSTAASPRPVSTRATSRSTTLPATRSSFATTAPATSPTAVSPPPVTPPTVIPSAVTPSAVTPPVITPSAVTPPAITPSAVTPPVVTPPTVSPPAVTPPPVSPPAVSPPAVSSPAVSPPATTLASTPSTTPTQSQPPTSTSTSAAGGSQTLTTLSIDWSDSGLNNTLGSIITGTNVNINWDTSRNSDNLPLSVLLKQGSGSEGGQVVSVIASSGVRNTGSFVWDVSNSLPPGGDYYIRLQTGTSDDWNGGLDTSLSTPGAVYGLAGYFTINSTTRASASATVTATHFVTCCTGKASLSPREDGIIAGSVIGGILALMFLTWGTWRWRQPKAPRPGANPSENRTFSFALAGGILGALKNSDRLHPAQLTLILRPEGLSNVQPIAWQVFNIDGRQPLFEATLPPDRGFGDANIEEDSDAIARINHAKSERHQFVSPGWQVAIRYDDGDLCLDEQSNFSKKRPDHIAIENKSEVPHNIIIGSYHVVDEDTKSLQPFGLVEVKPGDKLVAPHALRLQVYLTRGVRAGQVMSDNLLGSPLLRPVAGLKVADLKPGSVTKWSVEEDDDGVISLQVET